MGWLHGKSAVVTGGSRGIGRAIVERLARDGAAVVFNYARSGEAAADVVSAVGKSGGRAHAVQIDLAEAGAVDALMAAAAEHLDGLDVLVNNAALDGKPSAIADTDERVWDENMTVNAKSTFLTVRHAARVMRDGGRIINISTLNTTRPAAGHCRVRREQGCDRASHQDRGDRTRRPRDHRQRGLPRRDRHRPPPAHQPRRRHRADRGDHPLGRLGQPADVADVVALLASDEGRWLTGQIINATGGLG